MANNRFALSCDAHKQNICNGLSILQQNGEFVDMTLAADGHYVKVHQIVMALASPYIKDLLSSCDSKHPIIFLNKMSYATLCGILEYIYTGEVHVAMDNLNDIAQAGKELCIKGFEDMNIHTNITPNQQVPVNVRFDSNNSKNNEDQYDTSINETAIDVYDDDMDIEQPQEETVKTPANKLYKSLNTQKSDSSLSIQYTLSNQGNLQMILNRFIYYLRHSNRHGNRQWRCVDYIKLKCQAYVVTKGNIILQRIAAHTHPFHDKRILKKVKAGIVFSAIQEAELEGSNKKKKKAEDNEQEAAETTTNETGLTTVGTTGSTRSYTAE